ncbi:hypothetical protein ACJX0J_014589, partial [Zea mays]
WKRINDIFSNMGTMYDSCLSNQYLYSIRYSFYILNYNLVFRLFQLILHYSLKELELGALIDSLRGLELRSTC